MINFDIKKRIKNEYFWLALVALIAQLTNYFGIDITKYIGQDWKSFIDLVFRMFILLGVTVDTSTKGISDKIEVNEKIKNEEPLDTQNVVIPGSGASDIMGMQTTLNDDKIRQIKQIINQ